MNNLFPVDTDTNLLHKSYLNNPSDPNYITPKDATKG